MARSPDILGVSTDQIRADLYGDEAIQGDWRQIWAEVQRRWRFALTQIQAGTCGGVLYDATNIRRRYRRQVLRQAQAMGFSRCLGLWFDTPLAVCLGRNQQRSRQVPPDIIHRMTRQLQGGPPDCKEGFAALIRIAPGMANVPMLGD